jgi:5-methylcytosine-specific restriction enzyme B
LGSKVTFFYLTKNKKLIMQENYPESINKTKIWFVTQGATFTKDKGMKFLWAPALGNDKKPRFYWENLLEVKKGDFIFNYSKGLQGISIALSDVPAH